MASSPLYKALASQARSALRALLPDWTEAKPAHGFEVAEFRLAHPGYAWIVDVQRSKYWTAGGGEVTVNLAVSVDAIERILEREPGGRSASVRLPFLAFGSDKWWPVSDAESVSRTIGDVSRLWPIHGEAWFSRYGSPKTIADWLAEHENDWLAAVAHAADGDLAAARRSYLRNLSETADGMDPGGVRWRMLRAAGAGIVDESFLRAGSALLDRGVPQLKAGSAELFRLLETKQ